jgi:uncharacterized DUF497 family protein
MSYAMESAPDFVIERLVIEKDRPAHIARHHVTVDEVVAILAGDYVAVQGRHDRYVVIGVTEQRRILAVIVGPRDEQGTYGLITARPASRSERALHQRVLEGGEQND